MYIFFFVLWHKCLIYLFPNQYKSITKLLKDILIHDLPAIYITAHISLNQTWSMSIN